MHWKGKNALFPQGRWWWQQTLLSDISTGGFEDEPNTCPTFLYCFKCMNICKMNEAGHQTVESPHMHFNWYVHFFLSAVDILFTRCGKMCLFVFLRCQRGFISNIQSSGVRCYRTGTEENSRKCFFESYCFPYTLEMNYLPPTTHTHTCTESQGLKLRSYQLIIKNTERP